MGRRIFVSGSAAPAFIEPLEGRRLLSGFVAHVNFQPVQSPVPSGYVADTGAIFGNRGNGLSYGWNSPRPAQVVEHYAMKKLGGGPDARYDTFAVLNARGRGSAWTIAVPSGNYQVHIVAGDPRGLAGRYTILADSVTVVSGRASRAQRWVEGSDQVSVTDGKLIVTVPRGSSSKIDYIDIAQVVQEAPPPSGGNGGGGSPPPPVTTGWTQPLAWMTRASAPEALAEAQAIGVGGKLYMFGGYNVTTPDYQATTHSYVFDPAANAWSAIAPLPQPETHMGLATDGQFIYVAGGYTYDPRTTYQTFGTSAVWRYDIAENTWSAFASLPAPRAAGALVLLGRELHFFDGVDPSRTGHTDHWMFNLDAANPQWTTATALPFTRNHMTGAVLDGRIYAIGGQPANNDSDPSSDVIMWDPNNPGQWQRVASLPTPRSHAVTAVIDGRIVLAGGTTTNDVPIDSVLAYDPVTNTWTAQTSLPGPRLAPAGGVVGNQLVVTTGFENGLASETWIATVQ